MQKMANPQQHYAWGSKTALTELFNIANPEQLPQAEIWMGAHPQNPSFLCYAAEQRALNQVIASDPSTYLGAAVTARYGELPYMLKVLCAQQPLSIQVHPNKRQAELGFAAENRAGIALDAFNRNYKDANHKPELVFALTPFKAMNGFRQPAEIAELLQPLARAYAAIAHFVAHAHMRELPTLFRTLLALSGADKTRAHQALHAQLLRSNETPWQTIAEIAAVYPDDNGLFSPLLLNIITLQPGEAMFLAAGTPHAYLHGSALEVMASSDNVLRAGLTAKYIDIDALLANVDFHATPYEHLLLTAEQQHGSYYFPVPVTDFSFSLYLAGERSILGASATILFCIEGESRVANGAEQIVLHSGESCFIPANEFPVTLHNSGRTVRVSNDGG